MSSLPSKEIPVLLQVRMDPIDGSFSNGVKSTKDEDEEERATPDIFKISQGTSQQDLWATPSQLDINRAKWADLDTHGKMKRVSLAIIRICCLFLLLYFFICSLELLADGFKLVGGRKTSELFQQSSLLQNPVVGVMIGVLATVLFQSSSTATSVIVGMIASEMLTVKMAIPFIMGANIGTSLTNTIVSLGQAGNKRDFQRAFAGATVHDMFNWLTVIVLFILEVTTSYLYVVTGLIMDSSNWQSRSGGEIKGLQVITKPFINFIIQLNNTVLEAWSLNKTGYDDASMMKKWCKFETVGSANSTPVKYGTERCSYLFEKIGLDDTSTGVIVLILAFVILFSCLYFIVKVLQTVLQGQLAQVIKKTVNADIPYVPWLTGYLAIFIGAVMTMLVQSSSVFTSSLTPLVGFGVISLERMYPLTLGSNVGTTTTALLAAASVDPKHLRAALQVALCHLLFNVTGILLFFPIPYMRFPIQLARMLGETTAKYRWFAILYMVLMFLVLPSVVLALSIAGPMYLLGIGLPFVILMSIIVLINIIQNKAPRFLPSFLRTWDWLPLWMHSLEPLDIFLMRFNVCSKHTQRANETDGKVNVGYESASSEF